MFKKFVIVVILMLCAVTPAFSVQRVKGYIKSNGTYVQPHFRTNKNYTKLNNYSTKGNKNPYTGKKGYKNPYTSTKIRTYKY